MRSIVLAFSLLVSGAVAAGELRPFVVGSMAQIEAEHKGQPFVLLFWSLTCAYCPTELKMLAALKQKNPALNLVLVATDTPDESLEIKQRLTHYGLDKVEQWCLPMLCKNACALKLIVVGMVKCRAPISMIAHSSVK